MLLVFSVWEVVFLFWCMFGVLGYEWLFVFVI